MAGMDKGGRCNGKDSRHLEPRLHLDRGVGRQRSAEFYERYLGAVRDTFDFGADAVAFVGWPAFALNSARRPGQPGPSPETTSIQLWWRASDTHALYEQVAAEGVPMLAEPFDGPFGRTFVMADPDGYRITVYEKDQPEFWPPRPTYLRQLSAG